MFSDREGKILKILANKRLTFNEIAKKLFKDDMPMDANIMVSNAITRINKKSDHNKLKWKLNKVRDGRTVIVTKKQRWK